MNSLLNVTAENYTEKLEFLDALGFGGEMLLIGMLAVFAVLGIIFLTLTVFKYVFTEKTPEKKAEIPVAKSAPAPVVVTKNDEIVAVIAAAIAMAESECGDGTKFRVVSFRRK